MIIIKAKKDFLNDVPHQPGIYKMLDASGEVLYVGKAKDLKKRLSSYFRSSMQDVKTKIFIAKAVGIEITLTSSETEALLLENNLIKSLKPRYNILFKDDKSYPYLVISNHKFPQISVYRGAPKKGQNYFGPFPSGVAVRDTFNLLQKAFKLRSCKDTFFNNRTRPCMLYQVQRCSAPCVKYIDESSYAKYVEFAKMFLAGKSNAVIESLIKLMEEAAARQDYETAAEYRDQIGRLKQIQQQQYIIKGDNNVDIIALASDVAQKRAAVSIIFVRNGAVLGGKNYFPEIPDGVNEEEILTTFLAHYYLASGNLGGLPDQIILDRKLADMESWQAAITQQLQHKIRLSNVVHASGIAAKKWLEIAKINATESLSRVVQKKNDFSAELTDLQQLFNLPNIPEHLACFDVSHYRGEATVASCVVFDRNGPLKSAYRKFNIKDVTPGDDYAAMKQALIRYFVEFIDKQELLPDILVIDGGKGQLHVAQEVLNNFQLNSVFIISMAKGVERKPGKEEIYITGKADPIAIASDTKVFHLLQQIRDEAHRFAIQSQRRKMVKKRITSVLENISGIGKAKSAMLLKHFGGLDGVKNADIAELRKIPGIDADLARRIYEYLRV